MNLLNQEGNILFYPVVSQRAKRVSNGIHENELKQVHNMMYRNPINATPACHQLISRQIKMAERRAELLFALPACFFYTSQKILYVSHRNEKRLSETSSGGCRNCKRYTLSTN